LTNARMRWADLFAAQLPGILVTALTLIPGWLAITLLRHWEAPSLVVLIGGGGIMAATALLAVFSAPATFLGADGQWIIDTMRAFVGKFRPSQVGPTSPAPIE